MAASHIKRMNCNQKQSLLSKGGRGLEDLVRLAAKPIAYAGSAFLFVGLIYLGVQLKGGGEIRKAIAMIAASAVVIGFAALYGFKGF